MENKFLSQFFHHVMQEAVKYNSFFFPLLLNYSEEKRIGGKQSGEGLLTWFGNFLGTHPLASSIFRYSCRFVE